MEDIEQTPSTRITVTLSPKAAQALNDVAEWQEETKTDVINKAIRLYGELAAAQRDGRGFYVRTPSGITGEGELERVRFL